MNIDRNIIFRELVFAIGFLIVLAVATLVSLMVNARFNDGASAFFSGGPLVAGELVTVEPDWGAMPDLRIIELQLLDPPLSRRLIATAHEGKLYTNSHYMGSIKQLIWKRWPGQAERDGRAVIRICPPVSGVPGAVSSCLQGKRYERELKRIEWSPETADLIEAVTAGFDRIAPTPFTPEQVQAGQLWIFELAPRNTTGASR